MSWATQVKGIDVHFVLDSINFAYVVLKDEPGRAGYYGDFPQGPYDKTGDPLGNNKTRTVTHAELRWLYRNRSDPKVQLHVQFWKNKAPCEPPWTAEPTTWAKYTPRKP